VTGGEVSAPQALQRALQRSSESCSQETTSRDVSRESGRGVGFGCWEPSSIAGHPRKHIDLLPGSAVEL
jgi:hypothetical protein